VFADGFSELFLSSLSPFPDGETGFPPPISLWRKYDSGPGIIFARLKAIIGGVQSSKGRLRVVDLV
jgi:hypothetical protein